MIADLTGSWVAAFDCEPTCIRFMERNFQLNPALAGLLRPVEAEVGDGPEQTSLDDYAYSEFGFVPDFIKIDVDGGELGALRSASRILAERRPALIVDTHSAELERACGQLLSEYGYKPGRREPASVPARASPDRAQPLAGRHTWPGS